MTRNDLYGLLSDELVLADADADVDEDGPADADLAFGSDEAVVELSLRSSRSVAELDAAPPALALPLLALTPLALLAKGLVALAARALVAPSEPARGREGAAASGCARAFW